MESSSTCFRLDPKQRRHLRDLADHERDHRIARRLLTLLWLDQGRNETEVAGLLNVSPRSTRNWEKLDRTGGLDALCTLKHKGDKGELTEAQQHQLHDEIETGRFRTINQLGRWIEQPLSIAYFDSQARKLL